jgi:uncharacterized protein
MPIIQLAISNHNDVLKLFKNELDNYHFLINDLLRYKYYGESFCVYGEYEDDKLVSILLNNFDNVTYYSNTQRDVSTYSSILKGLTFNKLSGPSDLMVKFLPYVKVKQDTLSHLGVVKNIAAKRRFPDLEIGVIQNKNDLSMQYQLLSSIDEFKTNLPGSKEEFLINETNRLKQQIDSRTVFLSIDNEMVSSAATVRESESSAIIVGVCTSNNYRNKGFGTEVLVGLFEILLKEGKYPYLFYTNPIARSVYKNLGMEEVCEWRVINIE